MERVPGELLRDPEVKAAYDAHAADRELARAIIRQRLEMKISQQEMAEKMKVPQSNVSRLESGNRTPTLETLQRAAVALGVPLESEVLCGFLPFRGIEKRFKNGKEKPLRPL